MIAVDTSVVVAAFATWHERHEIAAQALARRPYAPAHVLVESYSVLTRLPAPHRAPAALVKEFLSKRFLEPPLLLPADAYLELIRRAASTSIRGGAIYDAVVAATAAAAGATLLTSDRRATTTYREVGVAFKLLA